MSLKWDSHKFCTAPKTHLEGKSSLKAVWCTVCGAARCVEHYITHGFTNSCCKDLRVPQRAA